MSIGETYPCPPCNAFTFTFTVFGAIARICFSKSSLIFLLSWFGTNRIETLAYAFEAVEAERRPDLLICDEILDTIIFGLIREHQLLGLVRKCKRKIELIMTGRSVPADLMDLADYATEFVQIKHPYYKAGMARKGIEY